MPNPMMMPGGMFGMVAGAPRKKPEEEKRQSYWQGGDKFTVRDGFAGALAAVGDGLTNWANGGGGGATSYLLEGRNDALTAARKAQAEAIKAAQEEELRQRKRVEMPDDLRAELKVRGEFKDPTPPRFEQDNAGNVWALDPMTGRPMGEQPTFIDRTERYMNQNGAILNVPNPYASQGGGQSNAPDRLPANFFDNPPRVQSPQSAAQQGPVPRLQGAQQINQQQYAAKLREFGGDQMSMNAWMRANNIIAGN